MCGYVGFAGGGVGGISPVMRTRASMPELSILRAAIGGILNRSWEDVVGPAAWSGGGVRAWVSRRGSVEGLGGGGGVVGVIVLPSCCCCSDADVSPPWCSLFWSAILIHPLLLDSLSPLIIIMRIVEELTKTVRYSRSIVGTPVTQSFQPTEPAVDGVD